MSPLHRIAVTAVLALATTLVPAVRAGADPPQTGACSPAQPTFCVSFGAAADAAGTTTPETSAAAPFDLALALANTSPAHATDQTRWLGQVAVTLVSGGSGPQLTPSSQLPQGLLLAGSAAACPPGGDSTFSSCTAGRGSALVKVSGVPTQDGFKTTTFGIQQVTNVQTTSHFAEYQVSIDLCVPLFSVSCFAKSSVVETVVVPSPGGGTTALLIPTSGTAAIPTGGTVDYALDAASLNLNGTSATLASGASAGQTFVALRLPTTCGALGATATATSEAGATAGVAQALAVTGCPTAGGVSVSGTGPRSAHFSTSPAGSSLGRAIASYTWTFGDGTSATTTAPTTDHTYPSSDTRSGTVVATDAAGARSAPVGFTIRGAAAKLSGPNRAVAGEKVRLKGALTSAGAPLGGVEVTLLRCKASGASCHRVGTGTTSGSGRVRFRPKVEKSSRFELVFGGGPDQLGATTTHLVKVRKSGHR